MTRTEGILRQYERAVSRLQEALAAPRSDIVRDSAIQRFEFSLDLAWKTVKTFLQEKKGIVCASPKECFREAYRQGMIEYDEAWIKLVDMRNETAHTYNEQLADRIYGELPQALKNFKNLLQFLKGQFP